MGVTFEWDPAKDAANVRNHGVSFADVISAFRDPLSITIPDPAHSGGERRFVLLGENRQGRLVVVVHTDRGERIRIISARRPDRHERSQYEKG